MLNFSLKLFCSNYDVRYVFPHIHWKLPIILLTLFGISTNFIYNLCVMPNFWTKIQTEFWMRHFAFYTRLVNYEPMLYVVSIYFCIKSNFHFYFSRCLRILLNLKASFKVISFKMSALIFYVKISSLFRIFTVDYTL